MIYENLLRKHAADLVDAHRVACDVSAGSISVRVFNDNKTIPRIIDGSVGFRVNTYDRLAVYLAKNWPDGAVWPDGVPRPTADEIAKFKRAAK